MTRDGKHVCDERCDEMSGHHTEWTRDGKHTPGPWRIEDDCQSSACAQARDLYAADRITSRDRDAALCPSCR